MAKSFEFLDDLESLFDQVTRACRSQDITFTEDIEEINEQRIVEPRRNRFVDSVLRCHLRRRICHDILPVRDLEHSNEYINGIRKQRYHGQLLIISYHESSPDWRHLHIVHDCSWSAGTCRCAVFQGLPVLSRRRRAVWTGGVRRGKLLLF